MNTLLDQTYKFVTQLKSLNTEVRNNNIDVSVITVNWNVKELITKMIQSLFEHTRNIHFEVIVVDNNSTDGSVEQLKLKFRQEMNDNRLKIIANDFNAGFAKANNQGIKMAKGKYVFFMNPDMEITENVLLKLRDNFENKPDAGIISCSLVYPDKTIQPSVKRLPTLCSQIIILLKLHHFLGFTSCIKNYLMKDFDYLSEKKVEQVMGACIFTRKDLITTIGEWDEGYWLWWEDVELCENFIKAGYKIYYTPLTEIIHYEGKSFAQTFGIKKQKRFNAGMLRYFKKHHKKYEYWVLWLLQPLSWILTYMVQILRIKARPQSRI